MRTRTGLIAAPIVAVALLGGGYVAAQAADGSGDDINLPDAALDASSLLAGCASGTVAGGTLDVIGPSSAEEAKEDGWPTSPREAAERTLNSPLYKSEYAADVLSLASGDPLAVKNDEFPSSDQFIVLDAKGTVRGYITVSDLGYGAYGTTHQEHCQ